jgi:hypothetical protein
MATPPYDGMDTGIRSAEPDWQVLAESEPAGRAVAHLNQPGMACAGSVAATTVYLLLHLPS